MAEVTWPRPSYRRALADRLKLAADMVARIEDVIDGQVDPDSEAAAAEAEAAPGHAQPVRQEDLPLVSAR